MFYSLYSGNDEEQYPQLIQSLQKIASKHAPRATITATRNGDPPSVSALLHLLYSITNCKSYEKYEEKPFFNLSKYWSHCAHVPQINTYAVKEKDMG